MATIIFDLDNTLLDTSKVVAKLKTISIKHGVKKTDFDSALLLAYTGYFGLDNYVKDLRDLGYSLGVASKIKKEFKNSNFIGYLKPGVENVLQYFKSNQFFLILLTRGVEDFQKIKIKQTGVKKFFNIIMICDKNNTKSRWVTRNKKTLLKHEPVWFVNDNLHETIEVVAKNPWLSPILYLRPDRKKYYKDAEVSFVKIKSISELKKIIPNR